jgi:hypothetical protein
LDNINYSISNKTEGFIIKGNYFFHHTTYKLYITGYINGSMPPRAAQKRKRKHASPTKIRPMYGDEDPDSDSDSSTSQLPDTLSQPSQPLKARVGKKNLGVRSSKSPKNVSKIVTKASRRGH